MLEIIRQPWPWFVAGPLIGLTIPILLLLGNKKFGISSSLKHICAACIPAGIPFFNYDWRKEIWNLSFSFGIIIGAFLATLFISNPDPIALNPVTIKELYHMGVRDFSHIIPLDIFSWNALFTLKGLFFIIVGGFLVGLVPAMPEAVLLGHSIMGLSNLQWPSLVATVSFFLGGLIITHFLMPLFF